MTNYTISGSPHVHSTENTKKIMTRVIIALVPALLVAIYYFGWDALKLTIVSIATCVLAEWLIQKFLIKGPLTINDGSAVLTGLLLAFNVPAGLPVWMMIVGGIVAIGIGKMAFGGLGKNPFNPALVGRVFMLVSFPSAMTTWPAPKPLFPIGHVADAITGPTPLGLLKEGLKADGATVESIMKMHGENGDGTFIPFLDQIFGYHGGSFGEICAIALLIGAIYLICTKVIDIWTPLSILLTVFVFTGICWLVDPTRFIAPWYHLVYGGLILGAFFMATDMVTSPMTTRGKLLFGFGIGVITVVIRLWGAYPEGVSFAILIMNAFTPLINKAFKPKVFGVVKPSKK
ncbi:MAG: RnfABCDGE type electron transport complex subunit D [Bacteroidales bacterium]|nr:RnfABCDGE type electron transport complex subunit D [Bacteroidales bacterium]